MSDLLKIYKKKLVWYWSRVSFCVYYES